MRAASDERVRRVRVKVVGQKVAPPENPNRRPRRTSEEMYRSLDAPWDADEILLGLNFWTVEEFSQHAKVSVEHPESIERTLVGKARRVVDQRKK